MRKPRADEVLLGWIVAGVLFSASVVAYALHAPMPGPQDEAAWKASVAALHAGRTR